MDLNQANVYHQPVMLQECIDALQLNTGGTFVDATFGGGGHSKEILKNLASNDKLLAFDRDSDALNNIIDDNRLTLIHHNYNCLQNYADFLGFTPVQGILADLGISSHQVDSEERGFSFRYDAPLDMRMDIASKTSVSDLINYTPVAELQIIFSKYGEVKNAATLAKRIGELRTLKPIVTTGQLIAICEEVVPHSIPIKKYLAPIFQALRIAVNEELNSLEEFLIHCENILAPGGRLVILTYHSLEDRIVKKHLSRSNATDDAQHSIYGNVNHIYNTVKIKQPSQLEISTNPRSRSAKLRVAIKNEIN
ncbi:MAG: 16S rRNA (cytosine(1402)-N(4))-methyltransferase RsmH [Bacteroidota bacterium]|nr:16S rRNA (cytosine(1402)-N(4))-methyltransferase RsmH [Bacteroidota bacterium]